MTASLNNLSVQAAGGNVFISPSGWVDNVTVAAGVASTYDLAAARTAMGVAATLPLFCVMSGTNQFYMNAAAAAALPTTSTADGSAAELSPNNRYFSGSTTSLSFISDVDTKISLAFYRP